MKIRMLFADARRRISDVNHMPAMLDIFDDESDRHMMRRFELTRAADDKPLYIEREAVPPLPYHVEQCPQCKMQQGLTAGLVDAIVVPREPGTLRAALISASERMLKSRARPHEEFHSPECPKWVTHGQRACRCGAAPTEGMFEDALEPDEMEGRDVVSETTEAVLAESLSPGNSGD